MRQNSYLGLGTRLGRPGNGAGGRPGNEAGEAWE